MFLQQKKERLILCFWHGYLWEKTISATNYIVNCGQKTSLINKICQFIHNEAIARKGLTPPFPYK